MIVSLSKAYFRMSRPTREDLGGGGGEKEGGGKGERGRGKGGGGERDDKRVA